MRYRLAVVSASIAMICLWASVASAQTTGLVIVGVGVQKPATSSLTQSFEVPFREEMARFRADYDFKSSLAFDIAGGALVTRQFGFLVGVSRFSKDGPATETVSLPHPVFFGSPATDIAAADRQLTHSETGVHLDVVYAPAMAGKVKVYLFVGPSRISLKQGLISDIDLVEALFNDLSYTVQITGFHYTEDSTNAWGVNGGATVSVSLMPNVGVGGTLRVSRATVDLLDAQQSTGNGARTTQSVKVGGVSATFGVTLSFGKK